MEPQLIDVDMAERPKISVSMIVKNEERYLRGCLESVKSAADEIVIVDTGSSDGTISIAEEYGASVYNYDWSDDFSAARNYALSKSSGEWILYLDADERLSESSLLELKRLTADDRSAGFKCTVKSLDHKRGKPHQMRYVRLFRNGKEIKFTGRVHEQIESSLLAAGYKVLGSDIEILHLGYNVEEEEVLRKARRNLKLLLEDYKKSNSPYDAFQLGNTYNILKEYDTAREYFEEATGSSLLKSEYRAYAYLNLSDYELKNHNLEKALTFAEEGLSLDTGGVLLNLLAADINFRLNKGGKAVQHCREAYRLNRELNSGLNKSDLAVELKPEAILSKGIYYSLLTGSGDSADYFLSEFCAEDKKLCELLKNILDQKKVPEIMPVQLEEMITDDSLDLFLLILENYNDKASALEILNKLNKKFEGSSKFHKTLGVLYSENKLFDDAVREFRISLRAEVKDPSAIFYYISVLIESNKYQEIPDLLIFAEREFSNVPEFNQRFKILKEKLKGVLKV